MADLQQTIGAVIRRERREHGMTLKELAERSSLSVVYVGELERGKKYPSALVLERLAEALDLTMPDLLELVAAELRGERQPVMTSAIGFAMPGRHGASPTISVKRLVNVLTPAQEAPPATPSPYRAPICLLRGSGEPAA